MDDYEIVQITFSGRLVQMERWMAKMAQEPPLEITIDGKKVQTPRVKLFFDPTDRPIPRVTTIWDVAESAGVKIPILCHREYMTPVAVCRVCAVQVKSADGRPEGRLTPACYRQIEPGMIVETQQTNPRVATSVRMLTELLLADHPSPCEKEQQRPGECELEALGRGLGVPAPRLARAPTRREHDDSSVVIAVDHNACILCDRCIRGCNEIRHNEVIGRQGKGYKAGIAFDLNTPMGDSSCVACGECMISCPTGALVNRAYVGPDPWKDTKPAPEKETAEKLAANPLFAGVSLPFLHFNEGAVVRRQFKKGDIICREGEYGSTAFYIERGSVNIFLEAPFKHVKSLKNRKKDRVDRGLFGLVRRFSSKLVARDEEEKPRDEESTDRFIHIDAPVPLRYDKPVATLQAGQVFGEMACMSNYPRSATVQAAEDCTVLEMLRNVLYILQRSKRSRALLDENYRTKAMDTHLRSLPAFADLLEDEREFARAVAFLRPRVELVRLNPGEVVFRQGDPADNFYMIRIGFIKVSQRHAGGEIVLQYLGPGKFFGEIALLSHLPEIRDQAPPGQRVATCAALDHADVVAIKGDDFRQLVEEFPPLREHLLRTARDRLAENQETLKRVASVPLGEFLRQGLQEAQSLLVLDLEKCTRCDECTKACADAHDGITRLIREGLRFDKYLVTTSCRSCLDPYCMVGCPVGSIRRRNSREIIIEDWCIGCGKCAENCPYGNINMHPFEELRDDPARPGKKLAVVQQKATTCDLCTELDGQPSCVYACPHDAAHRMSGERLLELVREDTTG
jgi:CRP-like cAMP-binding protein/Fe-S-cluster-containing hydrogenase component 2